MYDIYNLLTKEHVYCDFKPDGEELYNIAIQQKWTYVGSKTAIWAKYVTITKI